MQIFIISIIFSIICFIMTYYFNLYISQSVYTKDELRNIIPQLGNMINIINSKYSLFYLAIFYLISCFFGVLIKTLFQNWMILSFIFPLILYFSAPRLAIYFEQTRLTISENFKDIAEKFYTKYYRHILIGFFSGYSSELINFWINSEINSFYWNVLIILLTTALTVLTLRIDIFE